MTESSTPPSRTLKAAAWSVHLFTATGSVAGLFTLWAILHKKYVLAFTLVGIAIAIDAADGTLARMVRIKETLPNFDGALLDNLIDFLNYVIVPGFFILCSDIIQPGWREAMASLVVLSSCYQFAQEDAKTEDHYFLGFPSYWNIAVFYLYFWQTSHWVNVGILVTLVVLVFIPVKFIYPTRLEYVTHNKWFRRLILGYTWAWGTASFSMVFLYPKRVWWVVTLSMSYCVAYGIISLYRTLKPLKPLKPQT